MFEREGNKIDWIFPRGVWGKDAGFNQKNMKYSVREIEKLDDQSTWDARQHSNDGIRYYTRGDYEEALKRFEKALQGEQVIQIYAYIWLNKGVSLYKLERYKEALNTFDRAIEIDSKFEKAWIARGNVFSKLEKYQKAINCYDEALGIKPNYIKTLNNKAATLTKLGNIEEAKQLYNDLLEVFPEVDEVRNALDNELEFVALLEVEPFMLVWKKEDQIELSRAEFASEKFYKGSYKSALELFNEALMENSNDIEAWSYKARVLFEYGKRKDALMCLNKALEINPDHLPSIHFKLHFIEHHNHIISLTDKDGVDIADQVLKKNPNQEFALFYKGLYLWSIDKNKDALKILLRLKEINPEHPRVTLFINLVKDKLGIRRTPDRVIRWDL